MAQSSLSPKKLHGKVVIITGGASGIGEATARLFANHDPRVIVIADVQDGVGQKVAESIGLNICSYFHCDVSDEEQVKAMVDWTVETYGHLDIMFSNAGVLSKSEQKILDLDLSQLDHNYAVNVRGMAACVKHAARVMVERHIRGSIVCTASIASSMGCNTLTDYYMSKHAVLGLMRCAAKQLGEFGIRVNTVSPYTMATPMVCELFELEAKEIEKQWLGLTTLKGVVLKPYHIADAVLFLASNDSAFVTGHDLRVDGGYNV